MEQRGPERVRVTAPELGFETTVEQERAIWCAMHGRSGPYVLLLPDGHTCYFRTEPDGTFFFRSTTPAFLHIEELDPDAQEMQLVPAGRRRRRARR